MIPPLLTEEVMPTYVYRCGDCEQTIEAMQRFSDRPLRKHKECGGSLTKVVQAAGVVFKGSGYYSTESRTPDIASDS